MSWRLSITLETDFCIEALKEVLALQDADLHRHLMY